MGDGSQRADLEESARNCKSIDIIAGVPESGFTDVLAAADVLLLQERPGVVEMCVPSRLTSYFAAGRPVLAATNSLSAAAHEVIASGAGTVVDPGDPVALREAVRSFASAPLLDALGRRGQDYAEDRLSEAKALDAYRSWVGRLLGGGAPVAPSAPLSAKR